ncbi:hypothetical protein F2T19_20865 [Salmonella enterica]|nr:hypothetical protein [Salmonella enterica]
MSSDITALAHAARKYRLTFEAHCNNPSNADCVAEWDEATSEFMKLINNDEANIIASLLEKLDAAAETEQKLKELDSDYDAAITRHDITVATISAGWQKTSEEREAEKKRNATLVGALEKAQQRIDELMGAIEVCQHNLSDTEDAMHIWAERAEKAESKLITRTGKLHEPVAYAPKGHIARYLKGENAGCWVYGKPTNGDDERLYFELSAPSVKLPTNSGWNSDPYNHGRNDGISECTKALRAAGIKVKGE